MMNRVAGLWAIFILLLLASANAQSTVKTTTGGTAGTVPIFTTSINVENSVITQSGSNVGIGTTNPGATLDVRGGTLTEGLQFENASGVTYPDNWLGMANNIDGDSQWLHIGGITSTRTGDTQAYRRIALFADRMFISGNVGIGTTTPSQPLEVNGNAKVGGTLTVSGTGGLNVQSGGIAFPDGTVQTTAYPASSSGGSAPIEVVNNEAVINTGVSANGTGIKHVRTDASCTTGTSIGSSCTIQVNWPGTPFTDVDYTVTCTPKAVSFSGGSASYDLTIPDANKTTTYTTVKIATLIQSTSTTVTGLNCIAIHD